MAENSSVNEREKKESLENKSGNQESAAFQKVTVNQVDNETTSLQQKEMSESGKNNMDENAKKETDAADISIYRPRVKTQINEQQIYCNLPLKTENTTNTNEKSEVERRTDQSEAVSKIFKTGESAESLLKDIEILVPRSSKFGTIHNIEEQRKVKTVSIDKEHNSELGIPNIETKMSLTEQNPEISYETLMVSHENPDGSASLFTEINTEEISGTEENIKESATIIVKETEKSKLPEADLKSQMTEKTVTGECKVSEENLKKKPAIKEKISSLFQKQEEQIQKYDPQIHGQISYFHGFSGYEEVERYWVNEPYTFVVILFNTERNNHLYYIVEPELTDFEKVFLTEIKDRLRDVLLVEKVNEETEKEKILDMKIASIVKDYAIEVTPAMLAKISYYIKRDFIWFNKIDPLMHDDSIEDVSGNGHDVPIFLYHRKHTNIATNVIFHEDELNSFIIQLAQRSGKHISVAEPMVDATMPDGSRIQMTLGTCVTAHGSTFTIRKFSEVPITPVDLIKWGTFSAESMAYLWLCIENNKSLIYAGGTASGKTSSLNAVSLFIPEKAKIITLEDTRELKLPHPNWIPSVTRDSFTADERGAVDMYDLLKAALRQRPEYLLVGEVRGKEALTLFQAMSTGHTTFSTMHADSVASAIHRLENPPISVPRTMIQALDIMSIQSQTYTKGKRVRRNIKLVEITDIDPNTRNIRTNDIFVWDSERDLFIRTGESKALMEIKLRRGWTSLKVDQELRNRKRILEYMVKNNYTDFKTISDTINAYQSAPEKLLKKLNLE
ncbi:ATPase, T2SS/T4P/T4SS family [uncultured Methanomethylovorans sp.]|uniref:type II/IV secretion system ATPase subunit n=1 Tax=uncultured Methanomethylovorans sp. TaxID=183759 RepID=UPI002AA94B5A|nr:ATPase, T2SS/T4P/T4SS family [uncultured Methanomethylovorans sp.]